MGGCSKILITVGACSMKFEIFTACWVGDVNTMVNSTVSNFSNRTKSIDEKCHDAWTSHGGPRRPETPERPDA